MSEDGKAVFAVLPVVVMVFVFIWKHRMPAISMDILRCFLKKEDLRLVPYGGECVFGCEIHFELIGKLLSVVVHCDPASGEERIEAKIEGYKGKVVAIFANEILREWTIGADSDPIDMVSLRTARDDSFTLRSLHAISHNTIRTKIGATG
ncbi:MAG TPA: hypothetical protein VMA75_00580 [Candidatus Paceibacterota bacterium]|nr:hypothetical protein [Candidatus Paceibacterota bacterium]